MLAEEELRKGEERFRLAIRDSPVHVVAQDRELLIRWAVNPLRGMSSKAVMGKTDLELFSEEVAERLMVVKRRVLETGERAREELIDMREGARIVYDIRIAPLWDEDKNIEGLVCTAIDITECKRLTDSIQIADLDLDGDFDLPRGLNAFSRLGSISGQRQPCAPTRPLGRGSTPPYVGIGRLGP